MGKDLDRAAREGEVLPPSEKCLTCLGVGRYEQKYTESAIGAPPVERTMGMVDCFSCRGAGRLPVGTQARRAVEFKAFWCDGKGRCAGAPSQLYDDGECACCAKHHYHCLACGKVSQVG